MSHKNRGFTLLELIIVLAIIGFIASIVLPTLRRSPKSALMDGIRNLSSQIKLAYDNAIFTGRMHRMVFDVKNGMFWTEVAPENFSGRAPLETNRFESRNSFKENFKKKLDDDAKNAFNSKALILEIPVKQRAALSAPKWLVLNNSLIFKQKFFGNLVFAQISTGLSSQPLEYPKNFTPSSSASIEEDEGYFAYIYFFPSGVATPCSFQLGFYNNGQIDTNAAKYTLNLNTLTGQLKLLQGFQEANFELPK